MRAALLVTITACGRIGFDPLSIDTQQACVDGWCWEAPLPQGEPLYGVGETAPDDVWAVGGRGLVMHYDGTSWQRDYVGRQTYRGVAAIAPDDVWIAGYYGALAHFDGSAWTQLALPDAPTRGQVLPNAIWASASDDVWVGSFEGIVSHFDGTTWTTLEVAGSSDDFYAVWGSARDDVWFAGDNVMLHYNGMTFAAGAPTGVEAYAWGFARDDVWLGDVNNQLFHDAGGTWTPVPTAEYYSFSGGWSPAPNEMWAGNYDGPLVHATANGATSVAVPGVAAMWGFAGTATDAWGVGDAARFIHFDGTNWTPFYGPVGDTLDAISGTSDHDMWAVGAKVLLHRDATGWTTVDTVGGSAVWAVAPDDVFVAGTTLRHWNGTSWIDLGEPGITYSHVWASADDDVWVITGPAGSADLRHFDGASWSIDPMMINPIAIWGVARGDVWISTLQNAPYKGTVFHLEAGTWVDRLDPVMPRWIAAFASSSASDVWLLGTNPAGVYHWDGASVTEIPMVWPTNTLFNAGWARSSTEAYFSAGFGKLFAWNGTSIVELPSPTSIRLYGVWGAADRVWIVGENGAILSRAL